MKKFINLNLMPGLQILLIMLGIAIVSCHKHEEITTESKVTFSLAAPEQPGLKGGRISSESAPTTVIVTIHDENGKIIADHRELDLHKFGDKYLSVPITLSAANLGHYFLSEFLVIGEDKAVQYVTPKEGSKYAHLVVDPLDIEFSVVKNIITTVTPEVLTIEDHSTPTDYGYGQFGFKKVEQIQAVFSSFIIGASNFELTESHIQIKGLNDTTSTDTTGLWTYETNLKTQANIIAIKKAAAYRITVTKHGYKNWIRKRALQNNSAVEIILEKNDEPGLDVYVAGVGNINRATLWKNGVEIPLSSKGSIAYNIYVSNGHTYVAGSLTSENRAMYWKDTEPVYLTNGTQPANARAVAVIGNDVYVAGSVTSANGRSQPVYWRNGIIYPLTSQIPNAISGHTISITTDGNDVYISGNVVESTKAYSIATCWKNGVEMPLEQLTNSEIRSRATGIKLYGTDVFVSGAVLNNGVSFAAYWKNGKLTKLPDIDSWASDLTISNGDTFLAGGQRVSTDVNYAWGKCWKNEMGLPLQKKDYMGDLNSIVNVDGSIFAAGTSLDAPNANYSNHRATYWKNGEQIFLTDNYSAAYSIFVIKN